MAKTQGQNFQDVNDLPLKSIGRLERSTNDVIFSAIEKEFESPLRMHASFPVADSKLNFADSMVIAGDGAIKAPAPVKKQVFSLTAPYIDFQDQTLSDPLHFDIEWPAINTIGSYRRVGFSLIGSGKLKVLFSTEVLDPSNLQNAGSLLVSGSTPIGYIDLECTGAAGQWKTLGSTNPVIENLAIYRFGSGAGGGSGTGDADEFTTDLKARLQDSYFVHVTPSVFEKNEGALIDTATATYDLVDGVYVFSAPGQMILSRQLFGNQFLGTRDESRQIEVHALWFDDASVDENAIFSAALDGMNFETIPMERLGISPKFVGRKFFAEPPSVLLGSDPASGASDLTAVNSLTLPVVLSAKSGVKEVKLPLVKTGDPQGSYLISLKQGSTIIASKIALASSLSVGVNIITMDGFKGVLTSGAYSIVIETDATYKASYAAGVTSLSNDGSYEIRGHIYDLRLKVESSASGKKLKAFGMFYNEQLGSIVNGVLQKQRVLFSGDANQSTFVLDKFLPSPAHLKVYDVKTGQTYIYGAFTVSGYSVIFPENTFNVPGAVIELVFDQSQGTGYDHSEINGSVIAENYMGSMDATLDKSQPGKGPIWKNLAGKRRMLYLDENDNIMIQELE